MDFLHAPLWNHVSELRRTSLYIAVIIATAIVICFLFSNSIIAYLASPLQQKEPAPLLDKAVEWRCLYNPTEIPQEATLSPEAQFLSHNNSGVEQIEIHTFRLAPQSTLYYSKPSHFLPLVILGPVEGLLIAMKVSFWLGIVVSSPLWLFTAARFVFPGLYPQERRLILAFLILSAFFILCGCLFAFYITVPLTNSYLLQFNETLGTNLWSLERYLDYTLFFVLANGFAFELGAVGIFAILCGFVTYNMLVEKRRHAIIASFIAAALLTPPDVFTQVLLAVPMIGLYEALIWYARLRESKISDLLKT